MNSSIDIKIGINDSAVSKLSIIGWFICHSLDNYSHQYVFAVFERYSKYLALMLLLKLPLTIL